MCQVQTAGVQICNHSTKWSTKYNHSPSKETHHVQCLNFLLQLQLFQKRGAAFFNGQNSGICQNLEQPKALTLLASVAVSYPS